MVFYGIFPSECYLLGTEFLGKFLREVAIEPIEECGDVGDVGGAEAGYCHLMHLAAAALNAVADIVHAGDGEDTGAAARAGSGKYAFLSYDVEHFYMVFAEFPAALGAAEDFAGGADEGGRIVRVHKMEDSATVAGVWVVCNRGDE